MNSFRSVHFKTHQFLSNFVDANLPDIKVETIIFDSACEEFVVFYWCNIDYEEN